MNVWGMSKPGFPPTTAEHHDMMGSAASISVMSMIFMWWTMMIAMMMPGTLRHLPSHGTRAVSTSTSVLGFWLGYAFIWLGFSIAATVAQTILIDTGLLHGMNLWSTNNWFNAALLAVAGLYQFTDFKARRLATCRSISPDTSYVYNGAVYGLNCVVLTVPLMLLLFVGGVMNFYWVVSLSAIVTLEKFLLNPRSFSKSVGVACLCASVAELL